MNPPLTRLLDCLRRLTDRPGGDSDVALLRRFAARRDEDAFAALVARHGSMVFNVCCRVLGDAHAAEDAFQATFLVLARKAGSLRRPGQLPAWLYGVAHRVARKARGAIVRHRLVTSPAGASERADPRPDPLAALSAKDLLRALEEEIRALPGAYRMPVVLCCLEGLSQEEAARRLGWTAGSVKGRLERGRARLQARLVRRGLALVAALAAAECSRGVARAWWSSALAESIARAAASFAADASVPPGGASAEAVKLAHGGLQAMYAGKLKVALVLLAVVGAAGAGFGWRPAGPTGPVPAAEDRLVAAAGAERPGDGHADALRAARNELDKLEDDLRRLDQTLGPVLVEPRERLVELEERLRDLRSEPLPTAAFDAEEAKLLEAERSLQARIADTKEQVQHPARLVDPLQRQLEQTQRKLKAVTEIRSKAREERTREVIKTRKEMVRLEEHINALERERSLRWAKDDQRREAAAERVRTLEGAAASEDRSQRDTRRKLDALQREITELRRTIERQRAEKKE